MFISVPFIVFAGCVLILIGIALGRSMGLTDGWDEGFDAGYQACQDIIELDLNQT